PGRRPATGSPLATRRSGRYRHRPSPCAPPCARPVAGTGGIVLTCWSTKGGSGTTVVAATAALLAAGRPGGALLVDLGGDLPAVLGQADPDGPGVADWLDAGPSVPADGLARLEVELAPG